MWIQSVSGELIRTSSLTKIGVYAKAAGDKVIWFIGGYNGRHLQLKLSQDFASESEAQDIQNALINGIRINAKVYSLKQGG